MVDEPKHIVDYFATTHLAKRTASSLLLAFYLITGPSILVKTVRDSYDGLTLCCKSKLMGTIKSGEEDVLRKLR